MHLSAFVKYSRKQAGLTQKQLAGKAGVGLRFVRELEQGKETLRLDKINQVLSLFGHEMRARRSTVETYEILMNYMDRGVVITLKNGTVLPGVIITEVRDNQLAVVAWEFVPNSNAIEFQKTQDPALKKTIRHDDIKTIELQQR